MLTIYDYLVIGFYFVFMVAIGYVFRRFISNTSDYFRGGGQMLWWIVGASAFMQQFSAWTFTGAAGKAYLDGTVIFVIFFANAVGFFINFAYFAPRFRQMRVITAIQGVRDRFGRVNEQFFTWLQIPLNIVYASLWLNGLAIFVSAVFGFELTTTILAVGAVVLFMAMIGGAWAASASDFVQMLILMAITVVSAAMAVRLIGGFGSFVEQAPTHFFNWSEAARPELIYLWVFAMLVKQFTSTNNMLDASRYLAVRDSRHARRAALLGSSLFLIGPIVWFLPPMIARITHPDLGETFATLRNPSEAAFVAISLTVLPAGMVGLLISGIFAATMSSMDSGLNRNAGFFVKNFYQPILRPRAGDSELLLAGKLTTVVFGGGIVTAALIMSRMELTLFELMVGFGSLVAVPYAVPLIWGMLVKRAPQWAGWSTVLVGLTTSWLVQRYLTATVIADYMGWGELTRDEQSYWIQLAAVLINVVVGSAWFLGTMLFAEKRPQRERERVEEFFQRLNTPIDFERECGVGSDNRQARTLGLLCMIYGGFTLLLVLIPNPLIGRLAFVFVAAVIGGIGLVLLRASDRARTAAEIQAQQDAAALAGCAEENLQRGFEAQAPARPQQVPLDLSKK
jgi:solute:Na+ symporter, SSS family